MYLFPHFSIHSKAAVRTATRDPTHHRSLRLLKCRPRLPQPPQVEGCADACLCLTDVTCACVQRPIPSSSAAVHPLAKRSPSFARQTKFLGVALCICYRNGASIRSIRGATYVHSIIREALVFGFARWRGWMGGGLAELRNAFPPPKVPNGKSLSE